MIVSGTIAYIYPTLTATPIVGLDVTFLISERPDSQERKGSDIILEYGAMKP
jgi:hypothetical protein